jgi:hypothetical protein
MRWVFNLSTLFLYLLFICTERRWSPQNHIQNIYIYIMQTSGSIELTGHYVIVIIITLFIHYLDNTFDAVLYPIDISHLQK